MRNTIGAIALGIAALGVVAAWLDGRPAAVARSALRSPRSQRAPRRSSATSRRSRTSNAIKKLQRIYGFYTDKQLWSEAADLFSADGTIEVGGRGVYVGPERIREFLRVARPRDAAAEALVRSHAAAADRARRGRRPDGARPLARVRAGSRARRVRELGLGRARERVRERRRRLEDSPPSLLHDDVHAVRSGLGQDGDPERRAVGRPAAGSAAERRLRGVSRRRSSCRSTTTIPSRAPRRRVRDGAVVAAAAATPESLDGDARARSSAALGLLEDVAQLERMNSIYGYYLAHLQWDDLTGIFSPTGSIEIAMRGVYVGAASVRRNLNLYGQATDDQFGLQHNHMQFQPVVTVAPDGQSAKMRSRALSIMGNWERYSQWMGGVYENDFVKENGVWKIKRDQVFNTYFMPYAVGWKDVQPRPPPGITATNPPDAPPTLPFEMYPSAFLPPFHYRESRDGPAVTWTPPPQ